MRIRLLVLLLNVAGCNEVADASESGRCAVFSDLAVHDAARFPWPTNTEGDERQELWFYDEEVADGELAMAGFGPQDQGLFEERWSFSRPGSLSSFLDMTGDGYADLLMHPDGEYNTFYFYETLPDGTVGTESIPVVLAPGEEVDEWRDIDGDAQIDRVSRLDGQLVWVDGGTNEVHELGVPFPEDAGIWPLDGDSRLFGARVSGAGPNLLLWIGDDEAQPLWEGSKHSLNRGTARHGDHIDVVDVVSADDAWPADVVLTILDEDGGELEQRTLFESTQGYLIQDFDGDGENDLIVEHSGEHSILFGNAAHEFTEPSPFEDLLRGDEGAMQSFDVAGGEGIELLLAFPQEDGRWLWRGLGWEPCG